MNLPFGEGARGETEHKHEPRLVGSQVFSEFSNLLRGRVPAIMAYMRTRRPGNFSASPTVTRGRAIDRGQNEQENGLMEVLEDLELFEELKKDLLPELRDMVRRGEKSDVILEKGRALASARLVTLAATEDNPGAALAAIKEILDRTLGKVADKKQIEHRLAKIDDKELDALLISKITDEDDDA